MVRNFRWRAAIKQIDVIPNLMYAMINWIRISMLPVKWHAKDFYYRKFPKYLDTQNICCNHSKILTMWLYRRVMSPNDADGMANSVDPDQTAPDLGLHCFSRPVCPKT